MTDYDIGQCDDCGSDDGRRIAVRRQITISGVPTQVTAWVCRSCL